MTGFLITLANSEKYLGRNWSMHTGIDGLILTGDFVYYTGAENRTGGWVASLNGTDGFHVLLATESQVKLMTKAEDTARVQRLAGHLIGLTETLIDKHLPEEFKQILERTPEVVNTLRDLMSDGVNKALEKLGKGK